METFGLLNFLSSLLAKTEKNDENTTPNEQQTNFSEEKKSETQTEIMREKERETGKYNAFLSFIEAHDLRAKNTKK